MLDAIQCFAMSSFAFIGVQGGIGGLTKNEAFLRGFLEEDGPILLHGIKEYMALFRTVIDDVKGIAFSTSDGEERALWAIMKEESVGKDANAPKSHE